MGPKTFPHSAVNINMINRRPYITHSYLLFNEMTPIPCALHLLPAAKTQHTHAHQHTLRHRWICEEAPCQRSKKTVESYIFLCLARSPCSLHVLACVLTQMDKCAWGRSLCSDADKHHLSSTVWIRSLLSVNFCQGSLRVTWSVYERSDRVLFCGWSAAMCHYYCLVFVSALLASENFGHSQKFTPKSLLCLNAAAHQ